MNSPGNADVKRAINPDAICAAAKRIEGRVRRTPVMTVTANQQSAELKLESLQLSGTFKARGAFNRLLCAELNSFESVATASGGNHGIAVACAAQAVGVAAHIFVPEITPPAKREAIERYGATVHVGGAFYADASNACQEHVARSGALYCHAYDQPETLNGQGTVALEWESQTQGLDTVLIAVGGGGLIGGMAAWFENRVKVVAVESTGCPTLNSALAADELVDIEVGGIAADSLGARRVGNWMFPIAREFVDTSVLVSDTQISQAMHFAWHQCKVALEPGGAAALAAWLCGVYRPEPTEKVGILLCGANTAAPPAINQ
jgi:threonine dehydratase